MSERHRKTADEWVAEVRRFGRWSEEYRHRDRQKVEECAGQWRMLVDPKDVRVRFRRVPVKRGWPVGFVTLYRSVSGGVCVAVGLARPDGSTAHEAGYLRGTAEALASALDGYGWAEWRGQDGFGVLLDRLQECPEECEGLGAEVVAEAVEWIRRNL